MILEVSSLQRGVISIASIQIALPKAETSIRWKVQACRSYHVTMDTEDSSCIDATRKHVLSRLMIPHYLWMSRIPGSDHDSNWFRPLRSRYSMVPKSFFPTSLCLWNSALAMFISHYVSK